MCTYVYVFKCHLNILLSVQLQKYCSDTLARPSPIRILNSLQHVKSQCYATSISPCSKRVIARPFRDTVSEGGHYLMAPQSQCRVQQHMITVITKLLVSHRVAITGGAMHWDGHSRIQWIFTHIQTVWVTMTTHTDSCVYLPCNRVELPRADCAAETMRDNRNSRFQSQKIISPFQKFHNGTIKTNFYKKQSFEYVANTEYKGKIKYKFVTN